MKKFALKRDKGSMVTKFVAYAPTEAFVAAFPDEVDEQTLRYYTSTAAPPHIAEKIAEKALEEDSNPLLTPEETKELDYADMAKGLFALFVIFAAGFALGYYLK